MKVLDFLGSILFSAIEGLGIYFLGSSLFRMKPVKHLKVFTIFLTIMVLQSYFLREETAFDFVVPIISLLLFILFYHLYLKSSLLGSIIITVVSYTLFGLIQWTVMELVFDGINNITGNTFNGRTLQLITAIILLIISYVLLRFRIGFIADLNNFKFKLEKYITYTMILATIIGLAFVAVKVELMFIILVSFGYFLYFAIRKEKEDD